MKRKLSSQIQDIPIMVHIIHHNPQCPLAPNSTSPTNDIPNHKRIRKAGNGNFKETARRISSPESSMSTTLFSNSLGQRYPFPDDSPATDKAVENLHITEEVEKDLEEKIGEGGSQEMNNLDKTTAENTCDSLAEDLLSSLSKAPGVIVEPFVGPYINESPALSQRMHAPAFKDPSSSTSADQTIGQPEHNPAAGNLLLQTPADQDPRASKSSASLGPAAFFQDLENFLELENTSVDFQLSSANPAMLELSEEDFNKHVSAVKSFISFSLQAISHPGRLLALLSSCKALLNSTRLPSQEAMLLQQLVNTLSNLIPRYEVDSLQEDQLS